MPIDGKTIKGRGAQGRLSVRFQQQVRGVVHPEGIDEPEELDGATKYVEVFPKSILNRVRSPDLGMEWTLNPYQGCEHGCAYCYARPTHEYWGYDAGLDFERVVLVKRNAPRLLAEALERPSWVPGVISISGNTDCYQPVERQEGITRQLLEVAWRYRQPVGIITKNALVLRDLDILSALAAEGLASVAISLTTLREELRRVMEPRTSTAAKRLEAVRALSDAGVPVRAMIAPVVPGLTDSEMPALLKAAAEAGACGAAYTLLRTNGAVETVFRQWLKMHFPDRAAKVMRQTGHVHGGSMTDSVFGRRMKGEGAYAENLERLFKIFRKRCFAGRSMPPLDRCKFRRPERGQLALF
jgi:DNA repair photolyase